MKADDFKNKAFDEMLKYAVLQANEELINEMPPCEAVEFSKEHEKNMRKLFAGKVKRIGYIKRILIIAAIIVVLFGVSVMSVQGLRIRFMNFILSFTETNTKITYVSEEEDKNSYSVGDITLEYLPSGFALNSTRNQGKTVRVDFVNGNKTIKFSVRTSVSVSNLDTERAGSELLMIKDIETFVTQKDNDIILSWNNGEKVFELMGNIEREEIIKIAENIKIK